MYYVHYAHTAAKNALMAICYQYESAYSLAPYTDNRCFAASVAWSRVHAFGFSCLLMQQLGLAVGHPTFAISPQDYTRNDLRSEIQNARSLLAGALWAL